jgi:hypothetical protein
MPQKAFDLIEGVYVDLLARNDCGTVKGEFVWHHYDDECPTIEKVHSFIENNGSRRIGKHHEIYLSDIRRAATEKWETIVR